MHNRADVYNLISLGHCSLLLSPLISLLATANEQI